MKTLFLLLLLIAPQIDYKQQIKTFRNSGRFSAKYDKFRDLTVVSVGPFFIGGTKAYITRGFKLEMTAHFIDKDPSTFYLQFDSKSRDWTFLRNSQLLALADQERMSFYVGDRDLEIRRYGTVSESLIYPITIDQFRKIASADSSELKLSHIEIKLKNEHKEAFRDLVSLTKIRQSR